MQDKQPATVDYMQFIYVGNNTEGSYVRIQLKRKLKFTGKLE